MKGENKKEASKYDSGILLESDGNNYAWENSTLYQVTPSGDKREIVSNIMEHIYYNGYIYFNYVEDYSELPNGLAGGRFYNFCDGKLWRVSTTDENPVPEVYADLGADIFPNMKLAKLSGHHLYMFSKQKLDEPNGDYEYKTVNVIVDLDTLDVKVYDTNLK